MSSNLVPHSLCTKQISINTASTSKRRLYPGIREPFRHSYHGTVSQELTHANLTSKPKENLRSSILTSVHLPTSHRERLVNKRIAVNITDSPVQNSRIRARAQDQLRCLGRPVPIVLRDSQAVADANDLVGPVAAGTLDFERTGGGFGAVDVGEEDGFGAVVEDELRGDGVGGSRES
jgi:hypothetical protein